MDIKRMTAVLTAVMIIMCLAACSAGKGGAPETEDPKAEQEEQQAADKDENNSENSGETEQEPESGNEEAEEMNIEDIMGNITINTQSSIRIEGSKIIYVDPYKRTEAPHDADLILITHAHYDHFDPPSLKNVANKHSFIICPDSMKKEVDAVGLESKDGGVMEAGEKITPEGSLGGEVTIEAVPAYNQNKNYHPKANGWLGYIITMDGVRYYAAGDTDALPELEDIECDVAMVPAGGTFTMTASEAAGLVNSIAPKAAVPIHYGSIVGRAQDADTFSSAVDGSIKVFKKVEDAK